MAAGLIALLDDVAAIAKLAASSLDDVAAAAGKASSKAAGVVIDDAAVTPRYVTGLTPDRELPIIAQIAKGSVRNKLLFLLPAAVALSAFAPWAITPILMLGGGYLCFEGAEKLLEALGFIGHGDGDAADDMTDPVALENSKVAGAIRTDLILSGEIMAIALSSVAAEPLWEQAIVLAVVAVMVTAGIYGAVGLIVKLDDIGLHLARKGNAARRAIGRALVKLMPRLLAALSVVGTAAMLWVGGGIIVHGLEEFGLTALPNLIHHTAEGAAHAVSAVAAVVGWLVGATGSGLFGLVIGLVIAGVVHVIAKLRGRH